MRISDWSSDVCSSDLAEPRERDCARHHFGKSATLFGRHAQLAEDLGFGWPGTEHVDADAAVLEFERPASRERPDRRLGPGIDGVSVEHLVARERTDKDDRGSLLQVRSEEHTSELQSLMRISYAVFRLKKK